MSESGKMPEERASKRLAQFFKKKHNIAFHDPELLRQAFTHSSYVNELVEQEKQTDQPQDNERLEYLGDAVIELIVSQRLFQRFPTYKEGELTRIRSSLVRKETLAKVANELTLGSHLLLGHGEEESGGRDRDANLCALFEAVMGAIYTDQGFEVAHEFAWPLLEKELDYVHTQQLEKDPKSRLQEIIQEAVNVTPRYKIIGDEGPDHAKQFIAQVLINKEAHGVGRGNSKQIAEQKSAVMALYRLNRYAPEYEPEPSLEKKYPLATTTQQLLQAVQSIESVTRDAVGPDWDEIGIDPDDL
ncbi:MAG: ribonuclease III [Chloroflexota bacterium]